ncbi:uncharacterized protein LOC105443037 [Strongylocentrotus purpuratus]|uniref:Myb/SANT-like DNA-binding domain-containing protein n=1 Tax=Strongylocentrotus purpuratus TaxID=7668 RepID=A0A7M7PCR9_STRPU|nr:uncharacterized protein LOC105443037 [Strongylocentrotus purpuratus]
MLFSLTSCFQGRKPNWTHEEVVVMCDFVKQHREKLFGRAGHCSAKVESRKAKYWGKCAEVLRLQCGMERRASDVKTKWANIKVRANKYQSRKNRTGGGQAPTNNPTFEVILAAQAPQARFGIMGEEIEAGCSQSSASTSNGDETAEAMLMDMSNQVAAPSDPSIVVASSRTASSSASSSASTSASCSASSSASTSASCSASSSAKQKCYPTSSFHTFEHLSG